MPWEELVLRSAWKAAARMARITLPEARRVMVQGSAVLIKALRRQGFACTISDAFHRVADSTDGGFELAVCALRLHDCSGLRRMQQMAALRRLSPYALFLDWQRPERNLDLPASALERVLFLLGADAEKRRNRRDYEGEGALEGVLHAARGDLTVMERSACLGGCMGMALIRWKR